MDTSDDVESTLHLQKCLQKFIAHVNDLKNEDDPGGDGFDREFRLIRDLGIRQRDENKYPATEGRKPCNIKKNRYKDILPFDATRVTLDEISGEEGTDYINANFIKDRNGFHTYIGSQGPVPTTVNDFWRMLWKYKVKVVAMACRQVEMGKKKCEQYWPEEENGSEEFGDIKVTLISEEALADDCIKRVLEAERGGARQRLTQFHYTGWPDHDIPRDFDVILEMMAEMRQIRSDDANKAPMVIHCSAGCGRTGTICAIDYSWDVLKSGEMSEGFSLNKIVLMMRQQRQSMIQAPEQYMMAHVTVQTLFEKHLEMMEDHTYGNFNFGGQESEESPHVDHVYSNPETHSVSSAGSHPFSRKNSALLLGDIESTLKNINVAQHYGNTLNAGTSIVTEVKEPEPSPIIKKKPSSFKVHKIENIPKSNTTPVIEAKKPEITDKKPSIKTEDANMSKSDSQNSSYPKANSVIKNLAVFEANNNVPIKSQTNTGPPVSGQQSKPALNRMSSEQKEGNKHVTTISVGVVKSSINKTVSNPVQPSKTPIGGAMPPKAKSLKHSTNQPFGDPPQSSVPPATPTTPSAGLNSFHGNSNFFTEPKNDGTYAMAGNSNFYSHASNYSSAVPVNSNVSSQKSQPIMHSYKNDENRAVSKGKPTGPDVYTYAQEPGPQKSPVKQTGSMYTYAQEPENQSGALYTAVDKSKTGSSRNGPAQNNVYESVEVGGEKVGPSLPDRKYDGGEPANQITDKTSAGEINTLGRKTQLTTAIKNLFTGNKAISANGSDHVVPSDIPGYKTNIGRKPGGPKDRPGSWKLK